MRERPLVLTHEEPATGYEVIRRMQFEEEWFSRLEDFEIARAARVPKVDFMRRELHEVFEPSLVRDGNPKLHGKMAESPLSTSSRSRQATSGNLGTWVVATSQ